MDNNRIIAEWAGWKKKDRPATTPIQWTDDDFVIGGVAYWEEPPPYDTELAFWHGGDGLLRKIETKGIANRFGAILATNVFGEQWENQIPTGSCWTIMLCSTPAQLAEALKVIKEAE